MLLTPNSALTWVTLPTGYSLLPVLASTGNSPRNEMLYYHGTRLFATRKRVFKRYFCRRRSKLEKRLISQEK